MKKTISLIMAIVLSMTIFVSDVMGITMIIRAEDYIEDESEPPAEDPGDPVGSGDEEFTDEPEIPDNPSPSEDSEWEEALRKAEEEAAREAEEEARKAEEDAAAQEARRKAEEEEARAREAEEEAKKAQEEQQESDTPVDKNYQLTVTQGLGPIDHLDFGTAQVGQQLDIRTIYVTNTGSGAVDLITAESGDADAAFSASLHGDKLHLEPGDSTCYNVSVRSDLPAGTYKAQMYFASSYDPSFLRSTRLDLKVVITKQGASISSVAVTPAKATVAVGSTYEFWAVVKGTGDFDDSVRWSVSGNRSTGTFMSSNGDQGILTLASDETSANISVIASSVANANVIGYATVTPQRNSYNVSAVADPKKGGQVTGGGAVAEGGSVTLSAVPNKNYYFVGWERNGKTVSTSTNYTIKDISKNIKVTAKFAQNYVTVNVGVNNSNGGTVSGGGKVSYGGNTTLSAKAYSGYVFTGWKENGQVISRDASIKLSNLTVNRDITAVFKQTTHNLTVVAYPADTGKVEGGGKYKLGESATVKASAYDGYEFKAWYVGGQIVSYNKEYKIENIDQDFTITASFEKKGITAFEISAGVATTGGTISPSGKTSVAQGQSMTYTMTPKSGFAILAVAVDGVQVGAVNSYTFTNVQGPHSISVAFVQTDAGQKAATASGKKPQETKVQPIQKTEANTATETSTVDIKEAANGEGGDEFVEEMVDIEELPVPTDGELGIVEEEPEVYSDVTRMLGMSMNEVETMVATGNVMPVLDAAFYTGSLGAYVQNDYEPRKMNGVDYNSLSTEELMLLADDAINPSLPDLDIVVQKMLSDDEIMTMARGGQVDVSVSLTKQDPDPVTERVMGNAVGQKPLQYFDLTMIKSAGGYAEKITELPTTMEVVIEIPDDIYSSGKKYSVLRVHNGELSVLPDLDDDPKTITFRTDRFSSYAIAREVTTAKSLVIWLIAGAIIAFGVAATCFMILVAHQRKWRKARKHAH